MGYKEQKQRQFDIRYLQMARVWAENSYCVRRKVGALLVKDKMIISDGYNGTPAGFENICEDDMGTTKPYVLHAEQMPLPRLQRVRITAMARHYMLQHRPVLSAQSSLFRRVLSVWCMPTPIATMTAYSYCAR